MINKTKSGCEYKVINTDSVEIGVDISYDKGYEDCYSIILSKNLLNELLELLNKENH